MKVKKWMLSVGCVVFVSMAGHVYASQLTFVSPPPQARLATVERVEAAYQRSHPQLFREPEEQTERLWQNDVTFGLKAPGATGAAIPTTSFMRAEYK